MLISNMSPDFTYERWILVDLHIQASVLTFFKVFWGKRLQIHRSISIHHLTFHINLRWSFKARTKRFYESYLNLNGDLSETMKKDLANPLWASGKCWTENKSVISLLLLHRFNSSLISLLLFLKPSSCDRFKLELQEEERNSSMMMIFVENHWEQMRI